MAIDPGMRTGCKICTLDIDGNPEKFATIYLDKLPETIRILKKLNI